MKHFFLTVLFSSLLLACQSERNEPIYELSYDDYLDSSIVYEDMFSQKEDEYFVYIYSKSCSHCEAIKNDVLSFLKEDIVPVYLLRYTKDIRVNQDIELTIGVSDINDFYIAGTPTLVHIYEHCVLNNVVGEVDVINYINLYNKN